MPLLTRKAIILAKIESSYGVDPTPTGAANAILISNLNVTPLAAEFINRDNYFPYLGNADSVLASYSAQVSFEVEIAGAGAAGTAPAWGPLLRACGFAETVNAGVSVEYDPISATFPSVYIYLNQDGVLHKLRGARGDVNLVFNARQIPKLQFTFTGMYVAVTDAAAPTPTFTGFIKPVACNKTNTPTFSLHAASSCLEAMTLNMANQVVHRDLIGCESVQLTDRRPAGTISFEATTVATKDWWAAITAGTLGALQLIHGTAAGNIVQIDAPNVQILDPTYGDSDGNVMLNGNLALIPGGSGNDEIQITAK